MQQKPSNACGHSLDDHFVRGNHDIKLSGLDLVPFLGFLQEEIQEEGHQALEGCLLVEMQGRSREAKKIKFECQQLGKVA